MSDLILIFGFVLAIFLIVAQLKLFSINSTLKEILTQLERLNLKLAKTDLVKINADDVSK